MSIVKGTVVNVFVAAGRDGKEGRRVIQIMSHDGLRASLQDVADMTGSFPCSERDQVEIDCRVTEFKGRIQYAYWGGEADGSGTRALEKLFGLPVGGKEAKGEKGEKKVPF